MDKPTVYLETTIVSLLTARPSDDTIVRGQQQTTRQWWDRARAQFDLYISEIVVLEISRGDSHAASLRLKAIEGLPVLGIDPETIALATTIAAAIQLPDRAKDDALHLSIAIQNGLDYLVTWNCRHLANAELWPRIRSVSHSRGLTPRRFARPMSCPEFYHEARPYSGRSMAHQGRDRARVRL